MQRTWFVRPQGAESAHDPCGTVAVHEHPNTIARYEGLVGSLGDGDGAAAVELHRDLQSALARRPFLDGRSGGGTGNRAADGRERPASSSADLVAQQ